MLETWVLAILVFASAGIQTKLTMSNNRVIGKITEAICDLNATTKKMDEINNNKMNDIYDKLQDCGDRIRKLERAYNEGHCG